MKKADTIIKALNDYIGFLFSYTKQLENQVDELEQIVCDLDSKTPNELYDECSAYNDIHRTKDNILGRS